MTERRHTQQLLVQRFAACDEAIERIHAEKSRILKHADALRIDRSDLRRQAALLRRDEAKARADRRFEEAVDRILRGMP